MQIGTIAMIVNVRVSNANLFICHSSKSDGNLMQISWFSPCLLRFTDSVKVLIFKGSKTTANKCKIWKFTLVAKLTQIWCKLRVNVTFAPNFSRSKCVSLLRQCRLCKFVTNLEPQLCYIFTSVAKLGKSVFSCSVSKDWRARYETILDKDSVCRNSL